MRKYSVNGKKGKKPQENTHNKWDKLKAQNKVVYLNENIPIIILSANGLNSSDKRQKAISLLHLKKKKHSATCCLREILYIKGGKIYTTKILTKESWCGFMNIRLNGL